MRVFMTRWLMTCGGLAALVAFVSIGCSAFRQASGTPSVGGTIDGTVWDEDTTVANATVVLQQRGRFVATTRANEHGQFTFDRVARGEYLVLVSGEKHLPTARRISVEDGLTRLIIGVRPALLDDTADDSVLPLSAATRSVTGSGFSNPTGHGAWPFNDRWATDDADPFRLTRASSVSAFAADVDSASFTYVRMFLTRFGYPPSFDAIRTDELLNYFDFDYPVPLWRRPVSITTEIGPCPWAPSHRLALIGIRAQPIRHTRVNPRRIVLVVKPNLDEPRQGRLKAAIRAFVDTLRAEDRLAIAGYGGGLVLPSTPGTDRATMHHAIERPAGEGVALRGYGLPFAYDLAREHFTARGINQLIIATDGDFERAVGDAHDLVQLVERERARGIALTLLDVGTGDLRGEPAVERLVDRGSARYELVTSMHAMRRAISLAGGQPIRTVAENVRFDVAFNANQVAAWKVLGYQSRGVTEKHFDEDPMGSADLLEGDRVTMLYELVPVRAPLPLGLVGEYHMGIDPSDYPAPARTRTAARELFTVRVRYTRPGASAQKAIEHAAREGGPRRRVDQAAVVAEFAQLLLDGDPNETAWRALSQRLDQLKRIGNPEDRAELTSLVRLAERMMRGRPLKIKGHWYRRMPDGKHWTTENLHVEAVNPGTHCYPDGTENCQRFKSLYTWQTAREGCQALGPGWRLPTNDDWQQLAKAFGGVRDDSSDGGAAAYAALMEGGSSGFNAMFGGGVTPEGEYARVNEHGFYWTATESDAGHAWFYNFGGLRILNRHADGEKARALSVRCVRD